MTLRFVLFVLFFLFLFPFAFVIVVVVVVVGPLFQQASFSAEFLLLSTSIRGLDAVPPPFSLTQRGEVTVASAGIPL